MGTYELSLPRIMAFNADGGPILFEQTLLRGLMGLMAFTALPTGKRSMQAQPALSPGNTSMAGETKATFLFFEQFFLFSFMGRMAGQTLAGRSGRVLYGTSSIFNSIVTRKTQPVRSDNEQLRYLGSMPDMAGQAFPLAGRRVDTSCLLILPLRMTLHAERFRFLVQHVDKITGMDCMTCRAVSRNKRFMKSGPLIRDCMAVAAERINIFGNDQITAAGH